MENTLKQYVCIPAFMKSSVKLYLSLYAMLVYFQKKKRLVLILEESDLDR